MDRIVKRQQGFFFALILAGATLPVGAAPTTAPIKVDIKREFERFRLYRGGRPYYIKGAVFWGNPDGHIPLRTLAEFGGNSVRCGGRNVGRILDAAHALGLSVTVGIPMGRESTDGFDYDDKQAVRRQFEAARAMVERYKGHPALLMWGVGNELSLGHKNPKVWDAVNDVARMIHETDPNHPTMTATGDNPFNREFFQTLLTKCPHIDVLGVNSYGNIADVPGQLREFGWTKPYCLTEWGPTGHWQVPRTAWRQPIEETSTEKAAVIRQRYGGIIALDVMRCLGSYVFFWGHKQERTHTWYGMFLPTGERTEAVNVMKFLWTGRWPSNRAPRINAISIDGRRPRDSIELRPNTEHVAAVALTEPDGDPLLVEWELLPEPTKFGYGGRGERRPKPIAGAVKDRAAAQTEFTAPKQKGAYRLFVVVADGEGNGATANIPFQVVP
jgi:hypothetical protein